jgi:hypothetical protein
MLNDIQDEIWCLHNAVNMSMRITYWWKKFKLANKLKINSECRNVNSNITTELSILEIEVPNKNAVFCDVISCGSC